MYMKYTRKLAFEETPDYEYLRSLMDTVLKTVGNKDPESFDWSFHTDKIKDYKDTSSDIKTDNCTKRTLKGSKVKKATKSGIEGLKEQERSATMSSVLGNKTSVVNSNRRLDPHPSMDPLAAMTNLESAKNPESNRSHGKHADNKTDKHKKKGIRKILSLLFCRK